MKALRLLITIFLLTSCSLSEEIKDGVVQDKAVLSGGSASGDLLGPIVTSVGSMWNGQESVTALNLHSADELMPPVRGTDWYDFGVWTSLDQHHFDPANAQILNAWNDTNQGIVRANQAIAGSTDPAVIAQARFWRAYFVYTLADLFGQVPYREATDLDFLTPPQVLSRKDAITKVISELTAIISTLPSHASASFGTPSKEAAYFLLARTYLNKFVYDGSGTPPNSDMQAVIDNCTLIDAAGFSLVNGSEYFIKNFGIGNQASTEEILSLKNAQGSNPGARAGLGSRTHWTLHYNQNPSGWNGFVTVADFYNKWDKVNDKRFYAPPTAQMANNGGLHFGFLEGQQYGKDGVTKINTRGGSPLAFSVDCPLFGATEEKGVRIIKYEVDYGNTSTPGVNLPLFRYADAVLMKAEAYFRLSDSNNALTAINSVRTNRGLAALSSLTLDNIYDERGFELYWEGIRRTDQIRFGHFNDAWTNHAASDPHVNVFPLPTAAISSNPNLKQNPGY